MVGVTKRVLGLLAMMVGLTLCAQTGRLGAGGSLTVSRNRVPVLTGDGYLLMDDKWKGFESTRDAKMTIRRDGKQTVAEYKGKVITCTKRLVSEEDGISVTWEIEAKPDPRGAHFELCISIPAAFLDHLPRTGKTHGFFRIACATGVGEQQLFLPVNGGENPLLFGSIQINSAKGYRYNLCATCRNSIA